MRLKLGDMYVFIRESSFTIHIHPSTCWFLYPRGTHSSWLDSAALLKAHQYFRSTGTVSDGTVLLPVRMMPYNLEQPAGRKTQLEMRHFPQLVELQWPEPTVTDGSADLTELNYLDFHYRSHFWNEASRCSVSLKKKKPVLLLIKHRRFGTSYNDRNSHGHNTKRWYLIRFGRCPTGTQIHPLVFSSVVFQPHRDAMEYILFLLHRWIGNPPALIFFIYIYSRANRTE